MGRLSDTYVSTAIGMGNREMIDSGEGDGLPHALSRQSHSPCDIKSCGYITRQITPVRKKPGFDSASVRNGMKQYCRLSKRLGVKLDHQPTEK